MIKGSGPKCVQTLNVSEIAEEDSVSRDLEKQFRSVAITFTSPSKCFPTKESKGIGV